MSHLIAVQGRVTKTLKQAYLNCKGDDPELLNELEENSLLPNGFVPMEQFYSEEGEKLLNEEDQFSFIFITQFALFAWAQSQ